MFFLGNKSLASYLLQRVISCPAHTTGPAPAPVLRMPHGAVVLRVVVGVDIKGLLIGKERNAVRGGGLKVFYKAGAPLHLPILVPLADQRTF